MTELWRYIVRSYEHHYPETHRDTYTNHRQMAWFWRLCWRLCELGFVRAEDGAYWHDATWYWAFWRPFRWPVPWERGAFVRLTWREHWQHRMEMRRWR